MRLVIPVVAMLAFAPALQAQEDEALRRRIERKEADLDHIDKEIRRALDQGNAEKAERLNRDYHECARELEALRRQAEEPSRPVRPEKPARRAQDPDFVWVTLESLVTNWDSDLGTSDGGGFGAEIAAPDFLFFKYRAWGLEDDATGTDILAQAYLIGFTKLVDLGERRHLADFHVAAGVINFNADEGGPRTDSGPMIALEPTYRWFLTPDFAVQVGGSFDVYWTDFNQPDTRKFWNASLTFGAAWRF